ncbi:MAG: hypothetical protein IKN95_12270 [Lachnospiraceae bacterium]|nr:hypothetical protein [Lachnospiraceae bacterium]
MEWLGFAGTLITALGSLIAVVVTNKANNEKMLHQMEINQERTKAELEKAQAVTDTKITELTREVREHNNFAKRMPVLEEQMKAANHRIENLEKKSP